MDFHLASCLIMGSASKTWLLDVTSSSQSPSGGCPNPMGSFYETEKGFKCRFFLLGSYTILGQGGVTRFCNTYYSHCKRKKEEVGDLFVRLYVRTCAMVPSGAEGNWPGFCP